MCRDLESNGEMTRSRLGKRVEGIVWGSIQRTERKGSKVVCYSSVRVLRDRTRGVLRGRNLPVIIQAVLYGAEPWLGHVMRRHE